MAAAYQIRKFFGKEHFSYPYRQYNALMLFRILVDNPGPTFTQNIDDKFVERVRDIMRHSQNPSVQQLVRETLIAFNNEKGNEQNLQLLLNMWKKETKSTNGAAWNSAQFSRFPNAASTAFQPAATHSNGRARHALPNPEELSLRIEEARTSAKLLVQFVQTTPPNEFADNQLIKEFADRCQAAQRSLQGYMNCTDPAPDEHTFQTLIETCERLSLASSRHQRAALAARKFSRQLSDGPAANGTNGSAAASPALAQTDTAPQIPTGMPMAGGFSGNLISRQATTTEQDLAELQFATLQPDAAPLPQQHVAQSSGAAKSNGYTHELAAPFAVDPFADSNTVDARQQAAGYTNGLNSSYSNYNASAHPSTPPHAQQHNTLHEDDDDLYGATPLRNGDENVPPRSRTWGEAETPPKGSLEEPPRAATFGMPMPGMMSSAPPPPQTTANGAAKTRVKDDDAPLDVAGVSGSGWRY